MRFVEVIYFDEGTAADYVQITSGGNLKKTTEFISDVVGDAGVSAEAEATLGTKGKGIPSLFKALVGIGVDASLESHAGVEGKKERVAKTILENTLSYSVSGKYYSLLLVSKIVYEYSFLDNSLATYWQQKIG